MEDTEPQEPLTEPPRAQSSLGEVGSSAEKQRSRSGECHGPAGRRGGEGPGVTGAESGKGVRSGLLPSLRGSWHFLSSPPPSYQSQGWPGACKWAESPLQGPGSPWRVCEQLHKAGAWWISLLGSTKALAHAGAPASVTDASGMGHPGDRPSPDPFSGPHGMAVACKVLLLEPQRQGRAQSPCWGSTAQGGGR